MSGVEFDSTIGRWVCPRGTQGAQWVEGLNLFIGEQPGFTFASKFLMPHVLSSYVLWREEVLECSGERSELARLFNEWDHQNNFHDGPLNYLWYAAISPLEQLKHMYDWAEVQLRIPDNFPVVDVFEQVKLRQRLGDPMFSSRISIPPYSWDRENLWLANHAWQTQLLDWPKWQIIEDQKPPYVPFSIDIGSWVAGLPLRMEFPAAVLDLVYGRFYLWEGVRDPQLMKKFFNYIAQLKNEGAIGIDDTYRDEGLVELYSLLPKHAHNLLVLACGDGEEGKFVPDNVNAVGVDISPGMLERATNSSKFSRLVQYDVMRVSEVIEKDFADAVVLGFAYHWIQNPKALIQELKRVIKPGGVFIFNVRRPEEGWEHNLHFVFESEGCQILNLYDKTFRLESETVHMGFVRVQF
jgi:hypothetical protein